ncbi:MAG: hypothetical protein EA369_00255 [Bradymonadales bacterium]|nr:MAG: hypothetical protein EA369_00255 [Bradymonadales bacterium]
MKDREKQRITANIPATLLKQATEATNKGITDTLILGLELVRRSRAAKKAKELQGSLNLDIDLELSRERNRR